jgi:hypothetical protein
MQIHLANRTLGQAGLIWLALTVGCAPVPVGDIRLDHQKVALDGAKSARVDIRIGAGALRVTGGTASLLEADFIYNVPEWKPEISYEVRNQEGSLRVHQPGAGGIPLGNVKHEWNLVLNNEIPMRLDIELGAGQSDLFLGELALSELEVKTGVGETTVDLTGGWNRDLNAKIKGGIGQLNLRLPSATGARVETGKAIGSVQVSGLRKDGDAYVNDTFGRSKSTLRVRIEAGIGEIRVECR